MIQSSGRIFILGANSSFIRISSSQLNNAMTSEVVIMICWWTADMFNSSISTLCLCGVWSHLRLFTRGGMNNQVILSVQWWLRGSWWKKQQEDVVGWLTLTWPLCNWIVSMIQDEKDASNSTVRKVEYSNDGSLRRELISQECGVS